MARATTYRPPSRSKSTHLQELVDEFNQLFPVGTAVILRKDRGEVACYVRGPASVMHGHSAVAWFTGIAGCYSIEDNRVRLAPPEVADGLKALTDSSSL